MTVDVVTFGCRLNIHESELIRRAAGDADAIVVNTCAVTGEAVRQARQSIRKLRREQPHRRIVVTGCAAQSDPATFAAMPEIDRVLGNEEKFDGQVWASDARIAVGDIMTATTLRTPSIDRIAGHTRAFLQVQNGCDHRCTFCAIPFGRGNSRSLPMADAIAQARRLADAGHREIVLTGVDITSYGADLPDNPKLGTLVKRLLREVPGFDRLRLSSIDSVEADADLLDAFASEPRVMPHLHLSLQHGDDLILKRMKRRHSRADAVRFCDTVRRLRPEVAFSADLIAGFPTESDGAFARSLALIDDCGLSTLHVFPFSPRPGTPAARMPQLDRALVKERAARLRTAADAARRVFLAAQVGTSRRVLTEIGGTGHTEQFAPVRLTQPVPPGEIVDLTMTGHDGRMLQAG